MRPEKGKFYWVEFAYDLERRVCLAVTDKGGIFDLCGKRERSESQIRAEADAPKLNWLAKLFS